ncbi:nucleoside recognition domain protein [Pseudodesulfovibrio mercurii]|uniref:Nucleoside recognition domain protein n=1 Tax=Pseudodesulfovibrio mercurii TaxID=641491 RepID=F0JH66_9BACT|nr:nucleoside recognition domain-containing protein [Pseudodesulfovibrio mercurii]EGB14005.1 nucleoside recognition domain protein [Pseudodesulfovibrio mercurii]
MAKLFTTLKAIFHETVDACLQLFKIMIPVLVLVKILQEFGLIKYLAWPLEPVMGVLGLPAEMGLVWATTLINNIYTGMIVLASFTGDAPLTSAQATVLGVLMLVAHGLPVETAIADRSGARFLFQCCVRMAGAFVLAWLLHLIYSATGTLSGPAVMLFKTDPTAGTGSIAAWALGQVRNLASIFCIIFTLITIMRVLRAVGAIDLMNRVLRPVLDLIGIGPKASAITVIGLTMGLSYGGGLIIGEARNGALSREDVFYSLTFMGLCHSLIEDTLLIILIGGHLSGVLWGRLLFAVLAMAAIVQIVRHVPERVRTAYLWADK